MLFALENQNFPSAIALICLGAKIVNDQPLWTNGPLPIAVAAMNKEGNQFFHLFAQSKFFHEFLKDFLLGKNYEYNSDYRQALLTPNFTGQTPLHILFGLQYNFDILIYVDMSNTLLQKLFEPTDAKGRRPMHYLFDKKDLILLPEFMLRQERGDNDIVLTELGILIKKFINIQDNSGYTPLHLAAMHWSKTEQSLEAFRNLIEILKPNLNSPLTHSGESVLILAAKSGNHATAEYLLSLPEVDVNIRDDSGKTAMEYMDHGAKLQIASKRVSIADLEKVETRFHSFEGAFFEAFTATKKSDRFLAQLKNEADETERFKQIQEYLKNNLTGNFSAALIHEIPSLDN